MHAVRGIVFVSTLSMIGAAAPAGQAQCSDSGAVPPRFNIVMRSNQFVPSLVTVKQASGSTYNLTASSEPKLFYWDDQSKTIYTQILNSTIRTQRVPTTGQVLLVANATAVDSGLRHFADPLTCLHYVVRDGEALERSQAQVWTIDDDGLVQHVGPQSGTYCMTLLPNSP